MVFSFFLMVDNNYIMAHYDAGNKREKTISSSYGYTRRTWIAFAMIVIENTYRACEAQRNPGKLFTGYP